MDTLQGLQAELTHKARSMKDLVEGAEKEGRPMLAAEVELFDKLNTEVGQHKERIKAMNDHSVRAERMQMVVDDLAKPMGRQTSPDQIVAVSSSGGGWQATPTMPAMPLRSRPLKAFKNTRDDLEVAYRSGMWCRAVMLHDQKAARWCLNHGVGTDIRAAIGENSNTAGGFLVPVEFSQRIIDLREKYGVFRQNTYVQPMGRDSMDIPRRLTGITIGPVGENPTAAITESNPTWNNVQLVAKKAGGLSKMSTEIAEDAVIDIADWVANEFAYAFALFEDQCGFIGDQTSTYMGINGLGNILTVTGGLAGAVAAQTTSHDTFPEIDTTDLAAVMGTLPEYARMNAKWYCSALAREVVFGRLMAAAGGNNVITLMNGPGGGGLEAYMGYPIVTSQVLPAAIATDYTGLPMLYFGDLSKSSTLGDRREIRIFPSEHRYMDTDQVAIRATTRFDIVNHDLGTTTTAGPIVALCGGSA